MNTYPALKNISGKKGFSLVEVLIYLSIIGILGTVLTALALRVSFLRSKSYALYEKQANAGEIMEYISRKIRFSEAVMNPARGTASSALELDIAGSPDNLFFYEDNGRLYSRSGTGRPIALDSGETRISGLEFRNLSADSGKDSIRFVFTLEYKNSDSQDFSTTGGFETAASTRL